MIETTGVSRSFPTLRRLGAPFRWLFGSRRRVLTIVGVLVAIVATPMIWWSIQLIGLPDIGEPFDTAVLDSSAIPDERNAFILINEAGDRFQPFHAPEGERVNLELRWPEAHPSARRWLDENRAALALFRQGADLPDALDPDLASSPDGYRRAHHTLYLHELALLEASRLEDRGDMGGAWSWYRAILRASYLEAMRGSLYLRQISLRERGRVFGRLVGWSDDKRTTPALLRRALDDVLACESLMPSDAHSLMVGYLMDEKSLDRPDNPGRLALIDRLKDYLVSRGFQWDPDRVAQMADLWRFWRREPERSRRVMRLAIANRLAYLALPAERRPPPAPGVTGPFPLHDLGPEAPARARALSPQALDRWLRGTVDAREILPFFDSLPAPLRVQERTTYRSLVMLLASELYRRDHDGIEPPNDQALVGPYLKALPDDGNDSSK